MKTTADGAPEVMTDEVSTVLDVMRDTYEDAPTLVPVMAMPTEMPEVFVLLVRVRDEVPEIVRPLTVVCMHIPPLNQSVLLEFEILVVPNLFSYFC